jgi:hypothetical protein
MERKPARYGERSKIGVKRREEALNGGKSKKQKGVTSRKRGSKESRGEDFPLLVQAGTKHGDEKMRKM